MESSDPLVITGANGHLGRKLIVRLDGTRPLRAVVRSQRAADLVRDLKLSHEIDVRIADYHDAAAMFDAMAGSSHAVHLVGIIKETRDNRYHDAHEATCKVLADAAERVGLQRLVYLSILGSQSNSDNPCLASKGRAESLLLTARTPVLILQVPMVLGEDDYATRALNKKAHKTWNVILRASSREQPIYAEDVVSAIVAGLSNPGLINRRVRLAGPESLTRRALTQRGATVVGRRTHVISLPVGLGYTMAYIMEKVLAHPPLTRAMLGVLDHDDDIDPFIGANELGMSLTPLDEILRHCLTRDSTSS
ncbi:MAG: hypothetical protein E2O59_13630 [Gammaproteobacteria bacterium]|nr:MAG: hypothetical protein E2O59_13630 [Gammaproteobacteria bacterium]